MASTPTLASSDIDIDIGDCYNNRGIDINNSLWWR